MTTSAVPPPSVAAAACSDPSDQAPGGIQHCLSLAIIITTLNRPHGFARTVAALCDQIVAAGLTATTELVIVFDGCDPYAQPDLRDLPVTISARHNPTPSGVGSARNQALQMCPTADLIAFVDDDALPAPTWLPSLLHGAAAYPDRSCFGGRVRRANPDNDVLAVLRDEVYYRETFGSWYLGSGRGDFPGPPYVNGGNAVYRRTVFEQFGRFRTDLPAHVDVEYGHRIACRNSGVLLDGLTVWHDHPSTLGAYLRRAWTSGQARSLLRRDDARHHPVQVFHAIGRNLCWHNLSRIRRLGAGRTTALAVLTLQEMIHGFGYASTALTRRY